jgi:hypothetical protein
MTIKAARVIMLFAALLVASACGGASAQESIQRTFDSTNMSAEENKCVSDALAKYSGADRTKIRKAFDADGLNPSEPVAIEFMKVHDECALPSTRTAVLEEVEQASPGMSETQRTCMKSTIDAMTAEDLRGGALGARLAEACRL